MYPKKMTPDKEEFLFSAMADRPIYDNGGSMPRPLSESEALDWLVSGQIAYYLVEGHVVYLYPKL